MKEKEEREKWGKKRGKAIEENKKGAKRGKETVEKKKEKRKVRGKKKRRNKLW